MILPFTDSNAAKNMMDGIRIAVREYCFTEVGAGVITGSIGIAELRTGDNKASFFKRGDDALYQAKNRGRDCVVVI